MESKGTVVGIIGLGLIGGSAALRLRKVGFTKKIVGADQSKGNITKAIELGIIDKELELQELTKIADIIIVAIPVDASKHVIDKILTTCSKHQVVIDFGSTKSSVAQVVKKNENRKNYVACHPIAGTENSGPSAAFDSLFDDKVNIICDKESSSIDALETALKITNLLGMRPKFMDSKEHDRHIAYVSHLSHISSFTLGQTVLEVETNEENIFDMAGSGFESTVRLAKSSPSMWAPIFTENSENIIEVLAAYIANLEKYKLMIEQGNENGLQEAMKQTNRIRVVLDKSPNN
ncbi:MAG: prephenate dehydrogenase [Cyclobacteriaceae bacterium]|nr:prephenate dehydrogenase [Cyclobacteriaceae bacterium]